MLVVQRNGAVRRRDHVQPHGVEVPYAQPCDVHGSCYVRNDRAENITLSVSVTLVRLRDGRATPLATVPPMGQRALAPGPGALAPFCVTGANASRGVGDRVACPPLATTLRESDCSANGSDCLIRLTTASTGGDAGWASSTNEILLVFPYQLVLPQAQVQVQVYASGPATEELGGANGSELEGATVKLSATGGVALAVVLTTASAGRFSRNVLTLAPGVTETTEFVPWAEVGDFDLGVFEQTLRVEHLQKAMVTEAV